MDFVCFKDIALSEPIFDKTTVTTTVTLTTRLKQQSSFDLSLQYQDLVPPEFLPLVRLAFCMPLLNYGLFTERFTLNFPVSSTDLSLLNDLNTVFSSETYIHELVNPKAPYLLPGYRIPEEDATAQAAKPKSTFSPASITMDTPIQKDFDPMRCGILSSGGKESLTTYGMLKELGVDVHPLYVNESGGHWRTAMTAYHYHERTEPNTSKIWTNVDRFYLFMLDHLPFIRKDHRQIRADVYPIRMSIFPYYVFALMPLFAQRRIGNLLLGSEFDDLRMTPSFKGLVDYYGIYDQDVAFDRRMNLWYNRRMPGMVQWSAVRPITGLIVERILFSRYLELAKNQRSCHSCHIEGEEVVPCGTCSKCMGILLFLLANKIDPQLIRYSKQAVESFPARVKGSNLKLDQDEKEQSFFLMQGGSGPEVQSVEHVEWIHDGPSCSMDYVPAQFRDGLLSIMEEYTKGYGQLRDGEWVARVVPRHERSLTMRKASREP